MASPGELASLLEKHEDCTESKAKGLNLVLGLVECKVFTGLWGSSGDSKTVYSIKGPLHKTILHFVFFFHILMRSSVQPGESFDIDIVFQI